MFFINSYHQVQLPEKDIHTGSGPGTRPTASENSADEKQILADKDITLPSSLKSTVKRFKMTDTELEPLEDLPADFMRGEVDVKTQMDRAADSMDSSLRGLPSQSDEDSDRGEMGASFRDTPGGIEEASAKTDEYLASHGLLKDAGKILVENAKTKSRKKKRLQRSAKGF